MVLWSTLSSLATADCGSPWSSSLRFVKARFWYERAKQLGSTEAPRRLEQLASQVNSVP
jgi:hypothetical protein